MSEHSLHHGLPPGLAGGVYNGFDACLLADGARRYAVPHTLSGTVLARVGTLPVVGGTIAAALVLNLLATPFGALRLSLGSAGLVLLTALPVHALVALMALGVFAVTGQRAVTHITIRPDGLVWNDRHFFPSRHIWSIGYGTTTNPGKVGETFEPKIEIQVGTRTIVLAEHIDPAVGQLFARLFREDTRRYWHGHN